MPYNFTEGAHLALTILCSHTVPFALMALPLRAIIETERDTS
jgi:hypothetical protein